LNTNPAIWGRGHSRKIANHFLNKNFYPLKYVRHMGVNILKIQSFIQLFLENQPLGAFPFSRLEIQLFDLSRYFILYQWMVA